MGPPDGSSPRVVGPSWYALRFWIELGFRALNAAGWQWEHTRRVHTSRVARHWLVLAVATLLTLADGSRAEDADLLRVHPDRLDFPPVPALPRPVPRPHVVSVFRRGLAFLTRHLYTGSLWHSLWLRPSPWPDPPPTLLITYHHSSDDLASPHTYP